MGRYKTGVWTVYESFRIELSYLIRKGFLKRGYTANGIFLTWHNNNQEQVCSLSMQTSWGNSPELRYIQLIYTFTSKERGESKKHDYKIYFTEVPSNIGKGSIIYFICPQTGRRCRILYRSYNSQIFKSRYAYKDYLYYDCQRSSKKERPMNCFFLLEDHIEKLKKKNTGYKRVYRGQPTKAAKRLQRLQAYAIQKDIERWMVFDKYEKFTEKG
jgi:hypothetical protein